LHPRFSRRDKINQKFLDSGIRQFSHHYLS
jgi:hypothetical protein